MRKQKLVSFILVIALLLVALPLQVGAEGETVWTPIKSGQTVSGSASYGFNENYVITAAYDGELVLNIDFTQKTLVYVQNKAGKPFAPAEVQTNLSRIWHGSRSDGRYEFSYDDGGSATLTYKVQPADYYITILGYTVTAFDLTVYTPLQSVAQAVPNRSTVLVNGEEVAFDAYTINQNNYFKLRDLAKVLNGTDKQFEVTWDGNNKAVNMLSGKPYTTVGGELAQGDGANKTATISTATIYLDGQPVSLLAYSIGGNNYFKLRDVGQAFDFDVTWDGANKTILIDTTQSYTAD